MSVLVAGRKANRANSPQVVSVKKTMAKEFGVNDSGNETDKSNCRRPSQQNTAGRRDTIEKPAEENGQLNLIGR
jgi:hypothetical protein